MLSIAETFLFKFAVLGRKDYENKLFLLILNIDEFALVEIYFNGLFCRKIIKNYTQKRTRFVVWTFLGKLSDARSAPLTRLTGPIR